MMAARSYVPYSTYTMHLLITRASRAHGALGAEDALTSSSVA